MDTELKSVLDGIKSSVSGFQDRFEKRFDSLETAQRDIQTQVDAIDSKSQHRIVPGGGGFDIKGLTDLIAEDAGFQAIQKSGRGRAIITTPNLLELKATITSGSLVPYAHEVGIAATGRKRYRLRELIRSMPIDTGSAHFIREQTYSDNASPQGGEGVEKTESAFTFEADTADVKTLAHWTPASKQVLDDLHELGEHIRTSLLYGLEREFEEQVLNGDGTGSNFEGLTTTATAFDTDLLVASDGWEYVDMLRLAALQLEEAGYECSGFVVAPRIWARIELQEASDGQYINRRPTSDGLAEFLWSHRVVPSHAIGSDKFLAGDFDNGCHPRMRHESIIDISDSHDDYFTKNKIAIRAEMRAALCVKKPAAFIYGTFTQSPA